MPVVVPARRAPGSWYGCAAAWTSSRPTPRPGAVGIASDPSTIASSPSAAPVPSVLPHTEQTRWILDRADRRHRGGEMQVGRQRRSGPRTREARRVHRMQQRPRPSARLGDPAGDRSVGLEDVELAAAHGVDRIVEAEEVFAVGDRVSASVSPAPRWRLVHLGESVPRSNACRGRASSSARRRAVGSV